MNDADLIATLSARLTPAAPAKPLAFVLCLWLAASVLYVVGITYLLGPYRTGFLAQLASEPRFLIEMAAAALIAAIPGRPGRTVRAAGVLLGIVWLLHFVLGGVFPVLDPSMLGKREHCAFEAYVLSVPPLLALLWLQHRRFPLEPTRAAAYAAPLLPRPCATCEAKPSAPDPGRPGEARHTPWSPG